MQVAKAPTPNVLHEKQTIGVVIKNGNVAKVVDFCALCHISRKSNRFGNCKHDSRRRRTPLHKKKTDFLCVRVYLLIIMYLTFADFYFNIENGEICKKFYLF